MTFDQMNNIFTIKLKVIATEKPDLDVNLVECTKQMWNSRGIYD